MGNSWALVPMASRSRFLAIRQFDVPTKVRPSPSVMACTHQSCQRKECRRRVPKSASASVSRPRSLFDLLPGAGHGTGIEHLKLELAQRSRVRTARERKFHEDGKRGYLPKHHLGPGALEGQFELPVAFFKVVGRKPQILEPFHEIGAEHLAFAVKGVAAQPGAFAARQRQRADVVELFAQFAFVDQFGKADRLLVRLIRLKVTFVSGCCGTPTGTSAACRNPCRSASGRSGRSSTCGSRHGSQCPP